MKKIMLASLALTVMLGLGTSCKSKKSEYRKAYEQAKQREIVSKENALPPAITYEESAQPVQPVQPITVRKERLQAVTGENTEHLKRYSVVIGSFQNPTNARALKEKMARLGYNAVLAKNELGMLRVIVASFNSREEAAASRDAVKARFAPDFNDAWLLENE